MFSINLPVTHNAFNRENENLKRQLTEMEFDVVKSLYEICPNAYGTMKMTDFGKSDTPWTKLVFKTLSQLGKDKEFISMPDIDHPNKEYRGEWLFDLIWLKMGNMLNYPHNHLWMNQPRLIMACESEWGSDTRYSILEDFLKLTFSNAEIKLFIHTSKYFSKYNKSFAEVCYEACNNQNVRYLLIGFPRDKDGIFEVDLFEK